MAIEWAQFSAFLQDVVQVTATAVAPFVGGGDKVAVDGAAVEAIRGAFEGSPAACQVVVCEGVKDQAPRFRTGEVLGTGEPLFDLAIDPVDGTTAAALGEPGALVAIAATPRGSMRALDGTVYCDKLAVGASLAGVLEPGMPIGDLVDEANERLGHEPVIAVLKRERNRDLLTALAPLSCRVFPLPHADVSASIATAVEHAPIDIVLGVGGAPESLVSAAALRCLGGQFQCAPWPRNDAERDVVKASGLEGRWLHEADILGHGGCAYAIAGVTGTLALGPVSSVSIPAKSGFAITP
jgi:fructose-1,6-bisphosphatase II